MAVITAENSEDSNKEETKESNKENRKGYKEDIDCKESRDYKEDKEEGIVENKEESKESISGDVGDEGKEEGNNADKDESSGEPCPVCGKNSLALSEAEREVPYFGKVYLFSMECSNCSYHKADVECAEEHEPCRYIFEISCEEDMKVRVVKSSEATIRIPHIATITPGPASNGYVTNIEGILSRVKKQIEVARDTSEEKEDRKKAKNLLKKLSRIMRGEQSQKLVIEDPSGNSAIISEKAVKSGL